MGMLNTICAELRCPAKHEISRNTEIQIKWQVPEAFSQSAGMFSDVPAFPRSPVSPTPATGFPRVSAFRPARVRRVYTRLSCTLHDFNYMNKIQ